MERQTLKNTLTGVFEIFTFMPTAVSRFTDRKDDALKSFLFPLLLYPFIAWSFSLNNPGRGLDVLFIHGLVSWSVLFAYYAVVYSLARSMKKIEYFWQFVHMANAQQILSFILLIPVFLTLVLHGPGGAFFNQYWIFFIFVDMVFAAFVACKTLRLNWPLGGFLAVINLFISDMGNRLILLYADHGDKLT